MNRIVVLGVAAFFALVGIALVGGENSAQAGLFARSGGCNGCSDDCGGGCHGRKHRRCNGDSCCSSKDSCSDSCHGRSRCHGRDRCHGRNRCNGCNGGDYGCCGGEVVAKDAVQAPAAKDAVQAPVQK